MCGSIRHPPIFSDRSIFPAGNNVLSANYDASNPVESSGIVGKNFPFDLRIEALHRFEHTQEKTVPMVPTVPIVPIVSRQKISPVRRHSGNLLVPAEHALCSFEPG